MAKVRKLFECSECGATYSKWQGQCDSCGEWNTIAEVASRPGQPRTFGSSSAGSVSYLAKKLSEVETEDKSSQRFAVGSEELSQVLGGGLVPGSVNLLAGEPGIGKSTLLSQLTLYFAAKHGTVLYICGEESAQQVKLRLERLSVHKQPTAVAKDKVILLPEVRTEAVTMAMNDFRPSLTIIDSIQTLVTEQTKSLAGSVTQVRESGNQILQTAKQLGLSTFVVGHVTKGGGIAGPKVLEHMVDSVLSLTGERSSSLRILRAMKNRFGAVDEVGVFEMNDSGLRDVSNPSSVFLDEMQSDTPGSCVTVTMEGTRPILIEVQALVVGSDMQNPRRVAEGVKLSRLNVITAVLQKRCGIKLYDKDVFVNVVGGIRAFEPAVDLAIALAIVSSVKDVALPKKSVAIGEIGLLGEIRRVQMIDKRVKEAKKLGYTNALSSISLIELVKEIGGNNRGRG